MPSLNTVAYEISIWFFPVVLGITLHEAAHGFVAYLRGDRTAWQLGRVSLNPLKHIDPFGTLILPGLMLVTGSPFLFGYAKPVPVNVRALYSPRLDGILVAAAGPAMNVLLAFIAAVGFHFVVYVPAVAAQWLGQNLGNAVLFNAVLAVFNLIPIPPLDGGRIAVGLLPKPLSDPLARVEPIGLVILIGLLFVLPLLGQQIGINLDFVSPIVGYFTNAIINFVILVSGNS